MNKTLYGIKTSLSGLMHGLLDSQCRRVAKMLMRAGLLERMIVVRVDGGVSSQMHFYMIGRLFEKQGYKVKYDLRFFMFDGYDINHEFVRNFDLLKLFPRLPYQQASRLEAYLYSKAFEHLNDYDNETEPIKYLELTPPRYLAGYYRNPLNSYDSFAAEFPLDYSVLDKANQSVLADIKSRKTPVAMHIRRGDLSVYNLYYGSPVDEHYLNAAIDYIESLSGACSYFIFSDEPSWVEQNLMGELKLSDCRIVDINGSDKGYMDLLLMSACHYHITSKGTLGKYGGFLSNYPDKRIVVCDDKYERSVWDNQHKDIVFIKA